jgi:outer membrane protein TolC
VRFQILITAVLLAAAPLRAQAPGDTLRLTLDEAVQRALSQSEEVRLAKAQVMETNGQVREAFAGALPQLTGSVTYTRQFASIFQGLAGSGSSGGDTSVTNLFKKSPFGAPNAWAFEVTGSQLLFSAGKVGAGLSAAKSAREAARYSQEESATDVAYRVRQAYLNVLYRRRILAVAASAVEQTRSQLQQVQLFHQAGTRAEYDLLRARVEAANQEPAVVAAANDYDLAMLELKRLINVPLPQPLALATPLIPGDGTIPVVSEDSLDAAGRPALAAAEASVRVQQSLLRAAKADRWPTLSVTSTLSEQAFPAAVLPFGEQLRRNWNAAVKISVPIFNGLRTEGTVARYRAQLERATANRDQVREQAALDLAQAKAELARTQVLLLARRETVQQAEQAQHIAQVRYTNGLATQLEVSDARLLMQQAQVNEAQAMRDYLLSVAQIERALGRPVKVEWRPLEQVRRTIRSEDFHP